MKSKAVLLLVSVFVMSIVVTLAILAARLGSGSPPTVAFVGRTPDGSQLLFEIRNSSSATWNFYGAASDAPAYQFQMPSGRQVSAFAVTAPATFPKRRRYFVPAHGMITFTVPLPPGDTPSINVKVRLFPGSLSRAGNQIEYFSNKCRMFFGRKPTSAAVLQESGVVVF